VPLYREFPQIPVISISDAQREPLPWINWQGTVYHGLPLDLLQPRFRQGKYLAFLGRISPEKGTDRAIRIACTLGMDLKIAAKVDRADREYFEQQIKPLLCDSHVEFVGEICERQKSEFLGNALAVLFPVDWPEPFGLVMIEAMACGTPVVAFRRGSVPEVMDDGVTGFLCNDTEEAIRAVPRTAELSREQCRKVFEERFSAPRMARDYVKLYDRLTSGRRQTMSRSVSEGPWPARATRR
jgi:glycosyltransferase involved in cell wall biosynthesis